jgi:hypothetical protein
MSGDADFVREGIGFTAQKLTVLKAGSSTGAGYGEKRGGRVARPNGGRERDCEMRADTMELKTPAFGAGIVVARQFAARPGRQG